VVREIRLRLGTIAERRTRDRLRALLETYDLGAWTFTDEMVIDEDGQPHSHPVLTLDAGDEGSELLLAAFLHEQLHWFEEKRASQRDAAVVATRERWPVVPSTPPHGAGDEESTRLHLLVCHWEHRALESLLGEQAAARVVGRLAEHHYRWVYRTVLTDRSVLAELAARFDLVPPAIAR
jgi:hypothetical protein